MDNGNLGINNNHSVTLQCPVLCVAQMHFEFLTAFLMNIVDQIPDNEIRCNLEAEFVMFMGLWFLMHQLHEDSGHCIHQTVCDGIVKV